MEREEKRWINIARCIGIILVIHCHMIVSNKEIENWYYNFQMPIFYFISGYLINVNYKYGDFVKKKIKRLLIPYWVSTPLILIYAYIENTMLGEIPCEKNYILKVWFENYYIKYVPHSEHWFVLSLFVVELVGYIIIKYVFKDSYKVLIVSVLLAISVFINMQSKTIFPFHIEKIGMMLPFFLLGSMYRKYEYKFESYIKTKCIIYFIATMIMYMLMKITNNTCMCLIDNEYGNYLITYLDAIAGIGLIITLSKWISKNKIMEKIGKESLLLCLTHRVIVTELVICLGFNDKFSSSIVVVLIMIIVIAFILIAKDEYEEIKVRLKKKKKQ